MDDLETLAAALSVFSPGIDHLGSPDAFEAWIRSVRMREGPSLAIRRTGVTAVVGANNVGKSTLLNEIRAALRGDGAPESPTHIAEGLEVHRAGTASDFMAWADREYRLEPGLTGQNSQFVTSQGSSIHAGTVVSEWHHRQPLRHVSELIGFFGGPQERLNYRITTEMRASRTDPARHPLHRLQDDRDLMAAVDAVSRSIFGQGLTLDTTGRELRLRLGTTDVEVPRYTDDDRDYIAALSALPDIDQQGLGMKSVFALLLPLLTQRLPLVIVDEPEAFLHPPQAHALGAALARLSEQTGAQVILATHDRNIVSGLLSREASVSVVRLTRDSHGTSASQLDADQLRSLWDDAVLRHSNVLDGLFHRVVVLAEAHRDCAFLSAALYDHPSRLPEGDVLFLPTAGKSGMARAGLALRALDVPVVAAPDIDCLKESNPLRKLVESVGGEWTEEMGALLSRVQRAALSGQRQLTVGEVVQGVTDAASGREHLQMDDRWSKTLRAEIRAVDDRWSQLKDFGLDAVKGQERSDLTSLLDLLDAQGVVAVRNGELESLAPEVVASKGDQWLREAIEGNHHMNGRTVEHIDRILQAGVRN